MARRGERRARATLRVSILGAGKVGTSLAGALRARGVATTLRAARRGLPRAIDADLLVLTVRDRDLGDWARRLAEAGVVSRTTAVVHVSGALDAEPLAALRATCAGVGQMHPMISFASKRVRPDLAGGNLHVQGDRVAVARARRLGRLLGMTPRTVTGLSTTLYHAAAGLVANGAAALAAMGAELLVRAGVPAPVADQMLGPLLRSVSENVARLGFPQALTGPVRRGDARGVERHLGILEAELPRAVPLYRASGLAQLPLARELGEATGEELDAVERALAALTALADSAH